MKFRTLGKTGLNISSIGYGTWGMSGMWGPRDDRGAIDALKYYLEHGGNFIDTALVYGNGHSESLIASALKESKIDAIIATKVPPKNHRWPAKAEYDVADVFPPDHIIESTEASLRNLRRDHVDLQQLHVWSDVWMENQSWLEAVDKLKTSGKIKNFGVSINDHQPESALKLVESGLIDSVQVIFNIFDQSPLEKLFPICEKHNVGVIVRVPFDEGSLAGGVTRDTTFHKKDWRRLYFTPEHIVETCDRLERLEHFIGDGTPNLASLALKFCLHSDVVSTVIPGMRRISSVQANLDVMEQNPISDDVFEALKNEAWPRNFYPFQ